MSTKRSDADFYPARAVARLRVRFGIPDVLTPHEAVKAGLCSIYDWCDVLNEERESFTSAQGIYARTGVAARRPSTAEPSPAVEDLLKYILQGEP